MEKIQMTITVPQAQAIAKALDLFARLSIGQVSMIAEMVAAQEIPMYTQNGSPSRDASPDVCNKVREKIEEVSYTLGYSGLGHHLGISNEHVTDAGHRAYEISRVLEKVLAEHRNPNPEFRGMNYDGLVIRYTNDPMPVVQII